VFDLLADARTYPSWWRPVYLEAESDGPPEPGRESRQHFKGRLPYHLRTRSTITVFEPPRLIGADVVGDLRGRGLWTLTPAAGGTHVRFDWQVFADKPLLRGLTPVPGRCFGGTMPGRLRALRRDLSRPLGVRWSLQSKPDRKSVCVNEHKRGVT